jgi:hypothetical protein
MYGFNVTLKTTVPEAIDRVKDALATEGFGVLSEIDVAGTLKKKLDLDRRPYHILGACNPKLASQALAADPISACSYPATSSCARKKMATSPSDSWIRSRCWAWSTRRVWSSWRTTSVAGWNASGTC